MLLIYLQEQRRMSKFMGYAMAASQEALDDAGWKPQTEEEQEMTVRCAAFKERSHHPTHGLHRESAWDQALAA